MLLLLVILLLDGGHLHSEDLLHLGWQRLLHVLLDAAQQEGLQLFVEAGVAGVPALPVLGLKMLPGVKPAARNVERSWSRSSTREETAGSET